MKVCVFGAGNMGARIAEVFLTNGHDVTMLDVKQEFVDRGVKTITNDLSFLVKKEKMTEEHKNELLGALKTSLDRKAAADADFVMEVILERMDLKKDLLKELDEIRADLPDCSDGICRIRTSDVSEADVEDIVRKIMARLKDL